MKGELKRRVGRGTFLLGMSVGFAGGYGVRTATADWEPPPTPDPDVTVEQSPGEIERQSYLLSRLTSPFLEGPGVRDADLGLVSIRSALVAYIDSARAADPALRVSVYLRDLNNGPWIGIDEGELFAPASLFKVPVMMYTLARAETDPLLLQRKLTFESPPGEESARMRMAPEDFRMEPGQSYTYASLLFRMITYSDNYAQNLLMTGTTVEDVQRLMEVVHGEHTYVDGSAYVDAKTYSALFRILYNATFLDRSSSEYALGLLTRSYFHDGIRRPIPADVTVASKFGYWEGDGIVQLHECGIVYDPRGPYLLCVMTESGADSRERLAEVLSEISRLAWERVTPPRHPAAAPSTRPR